MIPSLIERARLVRRLRLGAALALVLLGILVASSFTWQHEERVTPPAFTFVLRDGSTGQLDPQFLVQATRDMLLAIGKGTQDLWALPLKANALPRLVGRIRSTGRARIVAAAARNGAFALLDAAGTVSVHRGSELTASSSWRVETPRGTGPIALLAASGGRWLVAERRNSIDRASRVLRDSALVVAMDSIGGGRVEWAFERVGPDRPWAFFSDYIAASAYGDTLVVTGADPPRIVAWRLGRAGSVHETRIVDARTRQMTPADRDGLVAVARSVPVSLTRDAIRRDFYPPLAGARPDGNGWFAIGGSGARTFALDYYCRGRFDETLLEDAGITNIVLLERAAVIVREEPGHGRVLLEYYPYAVFRRRCR